nr:UDP-N-acetylmuramoyl-L-alanyl-D-glutamate--2,6-diaminopimelate ligase [Aristophania vespae]
MLLSSLLGHYGLHNVPQHDVTITSITADSRKIEPGSLFVAIKGLHHDGAAYIPLAIFNGAAAVVTHSSENDFNIIEQHENGRIIPIIKVCNPAHFLAIVSMKLAGTPPHYIAAITGTNGKSSTVDFLRQIWQFMGYPSASIGTLGLISDTNLPPLPALTTPDAVSLAYGMANLKKHGIDHVAVEASSHGLTQHRLDGLPIKAAGFSNLTRDHLDYHGTLSAYRDAKLRLFTELLSPKGIIAFNADMDPETVSIVYNIAHARGFDLRDIGRKGRAITINNIIPSATGQILNLSLYGKVLSPVHLPLVGSFQAENALLAAALCWEKEEEASEIISLLSRLKSVPGRCELVATLPHGATAYVDYAHTPDALEHILLSLRPHTQGKIILVFGAGEIGIKVNAL